MNKKLVALGLQVEIVAVLLMFPSAARANVNLNTPVATVALPQLDSPVRIEQCTAIANDFQNNTVDPPAYAYTQVLTTVSFRDISAKTAVAVKFAFVPRDSFDKALSSGVEGTVSGTYSPGVLIEPHRAGVYDVLQSDAAAWTMDLASEDVHSVVCMVEAVRFANGTAWTADFQAEVRYDETHGLIPNE